jgi:teichuronic acid biosynthesis glycosyltransferase TuaH
MKPIDIIMFNMSGYAEWQRGVSNRNYHILKHLLQSDRIGKILAVDYPPLTIKRAFRNHKENVVPRLQGGKVVSWSLYDKLTKFSDRLYVYSNSEFCIRPKHFIDRVRNTATSLNFDEYIVWSYFPLMMEYLRGLNPKLSVFDAVDNWIEHASYVRFKNRLKQNYALIKNSVDVIFTVADDLQKLFDNQPNVYWVPNGVDLTHYQTPQLLLNRDIADLAKPIIGYIGVVQDRVDIDLIKFLAKKNATKSFVIVGPIWHDSDALSLKELPNIHLLGYKSYAEAPMYIQQFDVGLIPHRASAFVTSTNPMKLYEYLACGKPVLATAHSGVDALKDFVYIANTPEDANRKLFVALQEDTEELHRARAKAVEEYSWSASVRQMLDIIDKKMSV